MPNRQTPGDSYNNHAGVARVTIAIARGCWCVEGRGRRSVKKCIMSCCYLVCCCNQKYMHWDSDDNFNCDHVCHGCSPSPFVYRKRKCWSNENTCLPCTPCVNWTQTDCSIRTLCELWFRSGIPRVRPGSLAAAWISGIVIGRISEVTCSMSCLDRWPFLAGLPSRYVTSQLGQLSLASFQGR